FHARKERSRPERRLQERLFAVEWPACQQRPSWRDCDVRSQQNARLPSGDGSAAIAGFTGLPAHTLTYARPHSRAAGRGIILTRESLLESGALPQAAVRR